MVDKLPHARPSVYSTNELRSGRGRSALPGLPGPRRSDAARHGRAAGRRRRRQRRRARGAVRRERPGRLQAREGARGGRAGEPDPGRPAPAGAPRGGGVRPDDQVDRAVSARGRGAVRSAGRGARRDGGLDRLDQRHRSTTTTQRHTRKEQHHERDDEAPDHDRGRSRPAGHPDHPGVRCAAGEGLPGDDRSRAVRAVGRPPEHRHDDRGVGRPHGWPLPLHGQPGRGRLLDGLLRLVPRGASARAHRADLLVRRRRRTA